MQSFIKKKLKNKFPTLRAEIHILCHSKVTKKLLSICDSNTFVFGEHPRDSSHAHTKKKIQALKKLLTLQVLFCGLICPFLACFKLHESTEAKQNPQAHVHVIIIQSANCFGSHWLWQFYKFFISSWLNCSWTKFTILL